MAIQLIQGVHITATEKKAINQMVSMGAMCVHNRPRTKVYTIIQGWQESGRWHYKVKIDTRGTFTIGRDVQTDTQIVTIKVTA